MRVLLSAYACEPNRGSEPEIGWQRVLHIAALVDEVWVLTRSNNRPVIEADSRSHVPGLNFVYYDLPAWVVKLKKHAGFFYIYCALWQWGAYRLAARLHRKIRFDAVYHITFTGMIPGSFMGRLKIPFIVGPVAGGERAPLALRRGMSLGCKTKELLRDIGIIVQRYSPLTRAAFAAAERIYVTTADSLRLVDPKWHAKTLIELNIAITGNTAPVAEEIPHEQARFVFIGRLLHWKGVHLAIRAMAEVKREVPAATLTLIGSGPDEAWLRQQAKHYGVADVVIFAGQMPRQELVKSLRAYTALVFPSLHDSGGSAILEAMQAGVPVICLNIGGPGAIVNSSCGIVIPTENADEAAVVSGIANAMIYLGNASCSERSKLSRGAVARANELSWAKQTERIVRHTGMG